VEIRVDGDASFAESELLRIWEACVEAFKSGDTVYIYRALPEGDGVGYECVRLKAISHDKLAGRATGRERC